MTNYKESHILIVFFGFMDKKYYINFLLDFRKTGQIFEIEKILTVLLWMNKRFFLLTFFYKPKTFVNFKVIYTLVLYFVFISVFIISHTCYNTKNISLLGCKHFRYIVVVKCLWCKYCSVINYLKNLIFSSVVY